MSMSTSTCEQEKVSIANHISNGVLDKNMCHSSEDVHSTRVQGRFSNLPTWFAGIFETLLEKCPLTLTLMEFIIM